MTVTKILEQTLSAGSTSVSFTDADIPNSLIRVYSSNSDLIPVSRILSGNTLTVTYEAQSNAIDVAVEIVKAGLDIVDNLTSTDTDKALSAKQGKVLKDAIDTTDGNLSDLANVVDNLDIPDNITELNDVDVTSIQDGQVLAWDDNSQKFVNVIQSGGNFEFIHKAWIANSSTSFGTLLTETASLTPGIYIISVHTAPGNITTLQAFMLSINNTPDNSTIESITPSYGNYTKLLKLESNSDIKFISASGTSMTWDATYHDRGGMDIIKLS